MLSPSSAVTVSQSDASEYPEKSLFETTDAAFNSNLREVEKLDPVNGITYPDGGFRAWCVVFGSWCAYFTSFGLWNSLGVFQSYLSENQLSHYNTGTISWIFSLYSFLLYFCGLQVGMIISVGFAFGQQTLKYL